MAEGVPEYYPAVSVQLSRVLDDIGLYKGTIKRRRNAYLIRDEMRSMNKCEEKMVTWYTFGSQVEATTTPGLHSDIDILYCFDNYNAIQDLSEWVQGKINLMLLQEDTAPGHRRLQLLRSDVPLPREDLPADHYAYDGSGRVLFKNTLKRAAEGQENGPAISQVGQQNEIDRDQIIAFKCALWPREADEWKRRYQTHPTDWITLDLIQKAEAEGFFLVPVGYKLSANPDLEWRVSLSYTERLLMFSMNVTMLKCYTVLKMIVKTFITPQTGTTITSYHCKTAIFHCIDRTGTQIWRETNIIQCIDICLNKLKNFLENGNCVHFIMPDVNLFDGKITPNDKIRLLEILTMLTESKGRYIFSISVEPLGRKLLSGLYGPSIHQLDTFVSAIVVLVSEINVLDVVCAIQKSLLVRLKENDSRSSVVLIQQILQKYNDMRTPNTIKRNVKQLTISLLSTWIGSIVSSMSLSLGRPIPNVALRMLNEGTTYFITAYLKFASVFYVSGHWLKADSILCNIEKRFLEKLIISQCCCNVPLILSSQTERDNLYKAKTLSQRISCLAGCVIFTQQDMHCAPPALCNEMHRSMGDDMCHRDPEEDWWMDFAVVDSLPFLYYLQYLTYGQLEQRDLQKQALQKHDECLKEDAGFGHLEVGWNLLGQCMEQEQDHNDAMFCYQTSLEIRPRNNAANWHIQNLRYRKLRGEMSKLSLM